MERLTDAQNVIGMLNFDMLGGAKARHVGIHTVDGQDSYLMDILLQNYEYCGMVWKEQSFGGSDYMYFPTRLIPAIDFSHPAIEEENHNENDLAEYVSADMLEYAAKGGAAIATTIMSNITPSYLDYAKPKENNEIFEITPETYIPVSGSTIEQIQREIKIPLTQIDSYDRTYKYKVNVKLFDFEQPLDMVYEFPIGILSTANNLYIDLTNSGISYGEIKTMLDEKIGGGLQVGNSETDYIYNSIYGNCYQLSYRAGNTPELSISIKRYIDNDTEAYSIENGELIRLDSANANMIYQIIKTKDGVLVTETLPKASRDLEVSERAQKCWDRIKSIMTNEELREFSYFVLESDGFGDQIISCTEFYGDRVSATMVGSSDVEIPDEYKSLPQNVQSYIKDMLAKAEEGEGQTVENALPGKRLTVDYNDLLDEHGSAYTDADFVKVFAIMKGETLFNRQNQADRTQEYPENGTPFEKLTYDMKRDSQMYAFVRQFYQDIYSSEKYYNYDLFSKYPDEFVNEKATQSLESDMVYSFAEFVVQDEPAGDSIKEQKIIFFYDFPDLVAIREELRQHM